PAPLTLPSPPARYAGGEGLWLVHASLSTALRERGSGLGPRRELPPITTLHRSFSSSPSSSSCSRSHPRCHPRPRRLQHILCLPANLAKPSSSLPTLAHSARIEF